MIPGCCAGLYSDNQCRVSVRDLCVSVGCTFIKGKVTSMNPTSKMVYYRECDELECLWDRQNTSTQSSISTSSLDDYKQSATHLGISKKTEESRKFTLSYDIVSIDIGSATRGVDTPGVKEFALSTRPISRINQSLRMFEDKHLPLEPSLSTTSAGLRIYATIVRN